MNKIIVITGAFGAAALLAVAGWVAVAPGQAERYDVIGLERLTAEEFSQESYRFVPLMLARVYEAFGETEEAAIYDTLDDVASGAALEALYLERVGAMKGGGLEPDQQIHEVALLGLTAKPVGKTVSMDARWRVLGIVGHAEHLHMRGNAYAADLVFAPVDGQWRITGFTLTDVDRTEAGTTQRNPDAPVPDDAQSSL